MSQNLDKLFKQIQKNSEKLAMDALMNAANEAFLLAKKEANNCLENYLKKKPKIYKRLTPSPLKNATLWLKPTLRTKGDSCQIVFALRYDSTKIIGAYASTDEKKGSWWHRSGGKWVSRVDSPDDFKWNSQNNGIPDSGWILDNYLEGIHPGWYVTPDGQRVDHGWTDAQKPKETMKNFFEKELYEKAGTLIYKAMQNAVVDFLNTNGGGK